MAKIQYIKFDNVDLTKLMLMLNEERIRDHLVLHPIFDAITVKTWVESKIKCNALSGCRIRAIFTEKKLVGWCGIQQDNDNYEIAIVLSKSSWGLGPTVFKNLLLWANELGHQEVAIHLLDTRPEYRFLKRISTKTNKTKMLEREFTTYHIPVP